MKRGGMPAVRGRAIGRRLKPQGRPM